MNSLAAQCLTVNQAASSVELMALVAPLEVACRSQLDTYIDAYQRPFTAAILGALAIKHPHDLNDTHVMIIRLVWNKDAGPRIEEQFSLVEASVVTNAEFGLITGRYRGESDPTPDAQLLGSGLTLEANLASGGYYDRLATRPRIQTTLWFYTDSRLPVHSSIPVIEAYRTYTQRCVLSYFDPVLNTPSDPSDALTTYSIIIHKGRVEPPLPLDKDWYEHLRQDLARPPISHAEHMQRTISRIDKTSQEVIQYSIEANAFREFAPETEVPQSGKSAMYWQRTSIHY